MSALSVAVEPPAGSPSDHDSLVGMVGEARFLLRGATRALSAAAP